MERLFFHRPLAKAKQPKTEDIFWEDYCFDLQQAAEKAIKAVLLEKKIVFRYVHDLGELVTNLEQHGIVVPKAVLESVKLSSFAVDTRYPGPYEAVSEEDYNEALGIAEAVVSWAVSILI